MELCILCGTTFVQEMYLNEEIKHFTAQIIHPTALGKIQTECEYKIKINPCLFSKA